MTGMVAWLEAALDRVEELARAATSGPWSASPVIYGRPQDGWGAPSDWEIKAPSGTVVSHQRYEGGGIYVEADALHIALHDPAAVLRRVAADRQILAEHANDYGYCTACGRPSEETNGRGYTFFTDVEWPCRTVLLLAEAYGWTEETHG